MKRRKTPLLALLMLLVVAGFVLSYGYAWSKQRARYGRIIVENDTPDVVGVGIQAKSGYEPYFVRANYHGLNALQATNTTPPTDKPQRK